MSPSRIVNAIYSRSNKATQNNAGIRTSGKKCMFNIRKVKDTIVSKSVIPTSTTARMNAKLLADNFKLKEVLETLTKEQAQSPVVQSPVSVSQKVDLQKRMEINRIEGHAAKLVELDKKATESQVGYNPNSRFVIRDNNRPILATGCPNSKVQDLITQENVVLMAHGRKPYLNYTEWTDVGDSSNLGSPDVTWKKIEDPVLASSTVPVYISAQDYFLMFENDTCFFLTGKMAQPSILKRSTSECVSGQTFNQSSILISCSNAIKYRNMSKSEYNDIVSSQPSIADLFRVYCQWDNRDKVLMDTSKATTIWSKD